VRRASTKEEYVKNLREGRICCIPEFAREKGSLRVRINWSPERAAAKEGGKN